MTEHAAVIFVFFFLAEYGSIVLICILASILFLGGYLLDITYFIDMIQFFINIVQNLLHISNNILDISYNIFFQHQFNISGINNLPNYNYQIDKLHIYNILSNPIISGIFYSLSLAVKTCIMIFVFIWARCSFPRIRFDQLMSFCWTVLLPIVVAFIILIPCVIYVLEIIPSNIFI